MRARPACRSRLAAAHVSVATTSFPLELCPGASDLFTNMPRTQRSAMSKLRKAGPPAVGVLPATLLAGTGD